LGSSWEEGIKASRHRGIKQRKGKEENREWTRIYANKKEEEVWSHPQITQIGADF